MHKKTVIIHDLTAGNDITDQFGWENVLVCVALDHETWEVVGADVSQTALRERMESYGYRVVYEDDVYVHDGLQWVRNSSYYEEERKVFDEKTLMSEIVKTWGEAGAHADVYRFVLNKIENLRELNDDLAARINWLITTFSSYDEDGLFAFPDGAHWEARRGQ